MKQNSPYPNDTAGNIMITNVPTVSTETTVADIEKLLITETANFETIDYVYILTGEKKLIGVTSIKELFRQPKNAEIKNLMKTEIITVRPYTEQKRTALLALKNNLKSIPVVDKDEKFLGVVTSNEILQILDKATSENILHFGGIYHRGSIDDILHLSVFKSLKHRLPWLLLGLIGGMFAAKIIGGFEETLSKNLILAAFIPLIVYMADAVGTQMEAFIIRDLAVTQEFHFIKYALRQISIVSLIGIILSGSLYLGTSLLYPNSAVPTILGIALFFAILSSVVTGLVIPYVFGKFKLDPANASGPIATIIQDILSVTVYFLIASMIL